MMPGVLLPHLVATPAALVPLQGTIAEGAPVVPISAQLKYNVDAVRLGDWSVQPGAMSCPSHPLQRSIPPAAAESAN